VFETTRVFILDPSPVSGSD